MECSQILVKAIYYCDTYKVEKFIGQGVDVNQKDDDGDSASVIAARCAEEECNIHDAGLGRVYYNEDVLDYISIYKALQDAGADTTAEDKNGHTAR